MSEATTYQLLRKHCFRPLDRVDRIENLRVLGMPDVNYCVEGGEGWIELKSPSTQPKRPGTPLLRSRHCLSQDQKNWFLRHRRAGGRGWVLVHVGELWVLLDGTRADEINDMSITELLLASEWWFHNSHSPVQWERLRLILSGKHA